MSFKFCPILELLPISDINCGDKSTTVERRQEDREKVLSFAHITEENFLLILMLTNNANLAIYYATNCGSILSRCEKLPLGQLFPKQKLLNSHQQPILVALTEDASAVCLVSADSDAIFLIPFSSLLDVTWGRCSTPLVKKPTMFSILEFEEQEKYLEGDQKNLPTCAICYRSRKAERTFLLFGNGVCVFECHKLLEKLTKHEVGALFLVDLHIKKLSIRIELKAGIKSLSICADDDSPDEEQKYLLINLCDLSQIVLPLKAQNMQIRETFSRISAKDVHILDENVNYFPQKENNSICVLEKNSGTLRIYNSCSFNNAQSKFVQLDKVPTKNVQQLLVTAHFIAILTSQNQIFLHIRFLQSNNERSTFSPIQLEEAGTIGGKYFGILPAINNSFNILLADTHHQQQHHNQHKQCSSNSDILLIVTEMGLYWLKAEISLDWFILDHLNAQQNYSTDSLAKIATSLGPTISPLQLCLSLLRTVLFSTAGMQKDENQQQQQAQIHGLLSIALSNNVELELLLKLLQEYGQTNLLIPFLCLKCERNPSDLGMRRLLLTAMLTKISNLLSSNLGTNSGHENLNSNNLDGEEKAKLEGMELELRNFLNKFGTCDQNIMPILLRAHFWQCIFVLLSRDPKEHSPALACHLLEMPTWKCVPRLDGMLLCISFLHWPTVGTFTPTLLVKLFNLVPTLNGAQLRRVAQIADTLLTKMSMESALPLKLIVSMRLYGLEATKNKKAEIVNDANPSELETKHAAAAYVPIACGPNCTVALAENAFEYEKEEEQNDGQNRPMFWGEFVAGTSRMVNNSGEKGPTAKRGVSESKKREQEMPSIQANRTQKKESNFPLAPIPIVLDFDEIRGQKICCVASGTEHILLLSTDGRIFTFGRNRFGQSGSGNNLGQPKLIEIHGNWPRPLRIYAGHYHSAMITQNNEVWLWGWGLYGQLGNGKINYCFLPTKSESFSKLGTIKQICLGYAHTLALTEDGRVFGCGAISNGQLGIDPARLSQNPQKICEPIQIQFPPDAGPIAELASAYFHGLALTRDGDLFEWGECPQSLKMRMFLQKRLRAKQKEKEQQEMRAVDEARKDEQKKRKNIGQKSCSSIQSDEKYLENDDEEDDETNIDVVADNPTSSTQQSSNNGKKASSLPPINVVAAGQSLAATTPIEMPKHHLRIRRICKLSGTPIRMLSAGFNHSALLTTNGEIFTWGKSLEMQLGHGDRKEKTQPTRLEGDQKWENVICARNYTVALSAEGLIYIWGRNDRNQLGLGIAQMKPIRKILLKSEKGKVQKTVELPAENCVEKPTILTGLKVAMKEEEASIPNEEQLQLLISSCDQLSINSLSRFLTRYPFPSFIAVQAHLMAGDLLSSIRILVKQQKEEEIVSKKENAQKENVEERQISIISKISPSAKIEQQKQQIRREIPAQTRIGTIKLSGSGNIESSMGTMASTSASNRVAVQMRKTFCSNIASSTQNSGTTPSTSGLSHYKQDNSQQLAGNGQALRKMSKSSPEKNPSSSSAINSTDKTSPSNEPKLSTSSPPTISIVDPSNSTTPKSMEKFYSLVDRIWNLLRIHPIREVQTLALLELLNGQFPVYNRLAADLRFCRIIDNFIEFPSTTNSSDLTPLSTGQKRFFELSVRERQIALKKAIVDVDSRRFQSLKHRCEQILAQDRYRYFNDCGHFEKCIVESGPSQSEMATLRNRMRQCTRCCTNWIGSRRQSAESRQRMAAIVPNSQKATTTTTHTQSLASL